MKSRNRNIKHFYLLTTIISNHPNFQSNTSCLRGKRDLFIVKKLNRTRIIAKEAEIMYLRRNSCIVKEIGIFAILEHRLWFNLNWLFNTNVKQKWSNQKCHSSHLRHNTKNLCEIKSGEEDNHQYAQKQQGKKLVGNIHLTMSLTTMKLQIIIQHQYPQPDIKSFGCTFFQCSSLGHCGNS